MTFFLDSEDPPSQQVLMTALAQSVKAWAGYVGGPWAARQWSPGDFQLVRNAGVQPIFIYVGPDPNEAVALAKEAGIRPGEILVQDVEAGWTDFWTRAQTDVVRGEGFRPCLYDTPYNVSIHGNVYDLGWSASYTYPTVPSPIDYMAYQYWNSHTEFGMTVDRNVCTDAWLRGAANKPMDLDTARSIVHQALGLQGLLGDQAQVDAYATAMLPPNNPEAALTQLESDIKNDPRSLWSRVAKLESGTTTDATLAQEVTHLQQVEQEIKNVL